MKYIEELLEFIIIIILTALLGSLEMVDNISLIFIPKINKYLYIFVFLSFILYMVKTIIKVDRHNILSLIIIYAVLLFLTLFCREKYDEFQYMEKFYLYTWLQNIFKNKTIFINVLGNTILFIPLGFILVNLVKRKSLSGLLGIAIIVILEWLQFLTKRGVLDIVDIFLNSLGLILGVLITKKGDINLCMKKKKEKMKQKKQKLN